MLYERYFADLVCKLSICGKKHVSSGGRQMKKKANWQRRSLFQHQAAEFCQRSTLHGVADWYRADTPFIKGFWIVVFFGAMAAAFYGCYAILDQYMKSPVVVSYFIQQPTTEKLYIPDVVVCPFNRFDKKFLEKYNISDELAMYVELAFGLGAKHPVQRSTTYAAFQGAGKRWSKLNDQLNETLTFMNMTFEQLLDTSSVPCNEVLVHCVGANGPFNCCTGATVMSGSGLCHRVTGSEQKGSGYPFAMSIVVTLPKDRYHIVPNNMLNDGIAVKLAERKQGVDFDLTFVPVGTHAIMPIKATRYEFMNDPPRYECVLTDDGNYSQMECLDRCPWEHAQNICGCSHPAASYPSKLLSCTTAEVFGCLLNSFPNQSFIDNLLASCRIKCKPRCNYWQYAAAISYSKFPLEHAKKFAVNEQEWSKMQNSIILDVYYERSEHTVIKHFSAMTVHSFIANIGGQYSLWLGGSILTLIQLFVFLIQYSLARCFGSGKNRNRRCRNNSIPKIETRTMQPNNYDTVYDAITVETNGNVLQRSASFNNTASKYSDLAYSNGPQRKKSKHANEFLF